MKQWNGLLKKEWLAMKGWFYGSHNYAIMWCPFPVVCQYFPNERSKCDGDIADIQWDLGINAKCYFTNNGFTCFIE